jgi:mRNA-degrading endonuclease HigB of HigAB toxin-antitoxin module
VAIIQSKFYKAMEQRIGKSHADLKHTAMTVEDYKSAYEWVSVGKELVVNLNNQQYKVVKTIDYSLNKVIIKFDNDSSYERYICYESWLMLLREQCVQLDNCTTIFFRAKGGQYAK